MTERPHSLSDWEATELLTSQHGQISGMIPRRGSSRAGDILPALPSSGSSIDPLRSATKPQTARNSLSNSPDNHAPLHQGLPHHRSSNASRTSSTATSSSSLQALEEGTVVDARSDLSFRPSPVLQRASYHHGLFGSSPGDYPIYPEQSYAVLQSQIHPTYRPPLLRSRSSYPSVFEARSVPQRTSRTAGNTPDSSPGLFSLRGRSRTPVIAYDDEGRGGTPLLHPTHLQPPKETHTAEVDRDQVTGNKVINQYEIIEELGRGEHGKVKLGRHVTTGQQVAIKIVQRYSKRRRLGKLGNPEDKVKKEVAILKKARHPNVVSLLEVIDDPNRQKVYIVLEYVELGEIIWRRKGRREIVQVDKLRLEREKQGIGDTPAFLEESRQYLKAAQRLRSQRAKMQERRQAQAADSRRQAIPAWSLEHGGDESEEDESDRGLSTTHASSQPWMSYNDIQTSPSHSSHRDAALAAMEGSMYGAYVDVPPDRRCSTASSSVGYATSEPEWIANDDDMSYVPCLTANQARDAFRDSVLGLEYLHYQGIIHRDIKPANLLVTGSHRVKISDFGVSYLGRPIRDEDEEQVTEMDATELDDARELSKTVGTPAFYAPELCYTGDEFVDSSGAAPRITGAIDVWSLGVTLYGMIFGRLPFVSDDEYSMFQTIVKREVFIPRRRLKPVEDDPLAVSQWPRSASSNKRRDDELVYEDISDELYDLLKRLLTKDPAKRITLKEIKHHPWVLDGLPNWRNWIEETDPSYQSKGKKIEVSSEEVTTAVSKVPFIQRVRSNVAKWSHYLTGRTRERDFGRRTPSLAPSTESSSTSSSNIFGRHFVDSRRGSLRGDEESSRPPREHPLSQSVTASPTSSDDRTCYFALGAKSESSPSYDRAQRSSLVGRRPLTLFFTESTGNTRASDPSTGSSLHPHSLATAHSGSLGSSTISFLGGPNRRFGRGAQHGDWHPEKPSLARSMPADGNGHSEPSLAASAAWAAGRVQSADRFQGQEPRSVHGESRVRTGYWPQRLEHKRSTEPLRLPKEEMLRQRRSKETTGPGNDEASKARTQYLSRESSGSRLGTVVSDVVNESSTERLAISSSLATGMFLSSGGITSSMAFPCIPPTLPSDIIPGDSGRNEHGMSTQIDPDLRTSETIKARQPKSPQDQSSITRPVHYCYESSSPSSSSSGDEGIVIGKKKPTL